MADRVMDAMLEPKEHRSKAAFTGTQLTVSPS